MDYGRAQIVDADDHDRVIALVETQGAAIGDVPAGLQRFDDEPVMQIEDSPDLPPLWQVFGASRRSDGHWALGELTDELASPDAALHLARSTSSSRPRRSTSRRQVAGTDRLQVQSSHVMHLARGKVGPFRVDGSAHCGTDGRVGVQLTIHDEGNGDRAVTAGALVYRAL